MIPIIELSRYDVVGAFVWFICKYEQLGGRKWACIARRRDVVPSLLFVVEAIKTCLWRCIIILATKAFALKASIFIIFINSLHLPRHINEGDMVLLIRVISRGCHMLSPFYAQL